MMSAPCVSLLMAVRDGEQYLEEAMQSVLNQTFHDFECIVINDGSADSTAAILERYRLEDPRIRVYQQLNFGLVAALNRGLGLARGVYIARMDADDVSLPERLALQVAFMKSHPEVGICGTWIETFGADHCDVRRYPTDDATIRSWLLFESVLAHPSVMMRREVLERNCLLYDATVIHAEDYDLWVRAARHTVLANLPEVLLRYRLHPQQVVNKHEGKKLESAQLVRLAQLGCLGIRPTEEEMRLHQALSGWEFEPTADFLGATHAWLLKLMNANKVVGVYPQMQFREMLGQRWSAVCVAATHLGLWTLLMFWRSPLRVGAGLTWEEHLKFWIKCVIRKRQHA
jgi:glycosyltransferase involved in cell wall biosynthesis